MVKIKGEKRNRKLEDNRQGARGVGEPRKVSNIQQILFSFSFLFSKKVNIINHYKRRKDLR